MKDKEPNQENPEKTEKKLTGIPAQLYSTLRTIFDGKEFAKNIDIIMSSNPSLNEPRLRIYKNLKKKGLIYSIDPTSTLGTNITARYPLIDLFLHNSTDPCIPSWDNHEYLFSKKMLLKSQHRAEGLIFPLIGIITPHSENKLELLVVQDRHENIDLEQVKKAYWNVFLRLGNNIFDNTKVAIEYNRPYRNFKAAALEYIRGEDNYFHPNPVKQKGLIGLVLLE